ncbi:MAG: radical SAM protein [Deltaproteobacteria bacterium]|nr:radical SAM protein [Deltaproteobacteria bacterium]
MSATVLEGILAGRPLAGPATVHIDITNSCNTNCITCWDHSPHLDTARSAEWKRQRVERSTFEALLDDLTSLGGLRAIVLSGMGEPFTHPDVYDFIAAVKRRGLHLTIITNLVAADAERVIELDVDQLLVGIHGATEASYLAFHPSFRRAEWERLLAMLEAFRVAGRRFKQVQVVSAVNADELVEMVRFAARTSAAQVNFKLASLRDGTEATRVTDSQRRRLVKELVPGARRVAEELCVTTNLDVFEGQLAAGGARTAAIASVGCFMGFAYARVLVDGTVLYCCNTEVRVGSLTAGTRFSELWGGDAWQALRERFRRGDYLASCGQCGKLNQNVKLAERFERRYGRAKLCEVTGRLEDGGALRPPPLRLPLFDGGEP